MKVFENKKNVIILLAILIVLCLGIYTYKCIHHPYVQTDPYKELVQKIDSLNNKIDSLEIQRDTINN